MQTIKIPKVDPDQWHVIQCYQGKTINSLFYKKVYLRPQIIAGLKIPKDSVIQVKERLHDTFIRIDKLLNVVSVIGDKLNELLRYVYLESLRNKK